MFNQYYWSKMASGSNIFGAYVLCFWLCSVHNSEARLCLYNLAELYRVKEVIHCQALVL